MEQQPVLTCRNLHIGYRSRAVQRDLHLDLQPGTLTCVLGPNGAGKSTLLRTLCGIQPALSGELTLSGRPVSSLSQNELARQVAVVFTGNDVADDLTVADTVMMGRYPYTDFWGTPRPEDHAIVQDAIRALGMQDFSTRRMASLSDGERQKVMIAKAVAQECPIMLLDEPTAFLDLPSRIATMLLLRRLVMKRGKTILLSTHDIDLALQYADRIWLLSPKQRCVAGRPEALVQAGRLDDFFAADGIHFNAGQGCFSAEQADAPAAFAAPGCDHMLWLRNILVRNGFRITEQEGEAVLLLRPAAPGGFTVMFQGETRIFESTDSLTDFVESIRPQSDAS